MIIEYASLTFIGAVQGRRLSVLHDELLVQRRVLQQISAAAPSPDQQAAPGSFAAGMTGAAAPMAACTEQEADNAAYETGEAAENAGAEVAATTENAMEATGNAAEGAVDETGEAMDNATDEAR